MHQIDFLGLNGKLLTAKCRLTFIHRLRKIKRFEYLPSIFIPKGGQNRIYLLFAESEQLFVMEIQRQA